MAVKKGINPTYSDTPLNIRLVITYPSHIPFLKKKTYPIKTSHEDIPVVESPSIFFLPSPGCARMPGRENAHALLQRKAICYFLQNLYVYIYIHTYIYIYNYIYNYVYIITVYIYNYSVYIYNYSIYNYIYSICIYIYMLLCIEYV